MINIRLTRRKILQNIKINLFLCTKYEERKKHRQISIQLFISWEKWGFEYFLGLQLSLIATANIHVVKSITAFGGTEPGGMYAEGLRTARIHNIRRGNKSHRSLPLFLLSTPPSPREMEGSCRHVGESKSVEGATMRIHGYCVTLRVHEFFSRACILSVNTKLGLCTGV